VLTLMAVHAHPDDEATTTGGVLARYAAEGVRTVLVTCTDGRCGDGPGGVKPGEPGHDPEAVVATRLSELGASCSVLGISQLETLGYGDSGMMGWPQNDAPGAFWATPVDEAAQRLAGLMKEYQPDVIVTYDENGFYGHPDHIQAHRITMAAVQASGTSAKVYWTTVPRSAMAEFGALIAELEAEQAVSPDATQPPDSTERTGSTDQPEDEMAEMGLPDDQITTWIDTRAFSDQKFDSLAAHASQTENLFFLRMGRERFSQYMGIETFVRVDRQLPAGVREDDLFHGLRSESAPQ
jgi:LmbE family N-acetylglucosaminyl deacetylase